jgi:hypothetical protein
MPAKAPKTGLAAQMRAWMKAQSRPFTKRDVYLGIGIESPEERAIARNAAYDFAVRGEILLQPPDKRNRRQDVNRYRYNAAWQGGQKGSLMPRILKAMRVSGTFAVTDILRLCTRPDEKISRAWIDKIVRRLRRAGHLTIVGRRLCAHRAGAEALYHVVDRDKFRLEVMR